MPAAAGHPLLADPRGAGRSAGARATRQTGTLFERMSNIARGAAKAQVAEEHRRGGSPRMRAGARDPLDIPRFLNRQNNQ